MSDQPQKSMEEVILEDGRYPPEAYAFLHDGMEMAIESAYGVEPSAGQQKHVTGKEICLALRDLASERWGMLSRTVLFKWNIHKTDDFGNMVYLLIRYGLMRKTEGDSIEDFHDVYNFDSTFGTLN